METKPCIACGQKFRPRPQTPDQQFCSQPECQRERRRRWQQAKRRDDPDYRDNDTRSSKEWAAENPEKEGNIRDYATIHQLVVLVNIESFNAELIRVGMSQSKRLIELNQMAIRQLKALSSNTTIKKLGNE